MKKINLTLLAIFIFKCEYQLKINEANQYHYDKIKTIKIVNLICINIIST